MMFNLFLKHGYFPKSFIRSIIVPFVKNKNGCLSDMSNYRAITLSNTLATIFESILMNAAMSTDVVNMHQFGFKQSHSTTLCTQVLKTVGDYYSRRGSDVYVCFIDFSKVFDSVNYYKLFSMLLDDGVNTCD